MNWNLEVKNRMYGLKPTAIKTIYVGFTFPSLASVDCALDWIKRQSGYKDKSVLYQIICADHIERD